MAPLQAARCECASRGPCSAALGVLSGRAGTNAPLGACILRLRSPCAAGSQTRGEVRNGEKPCARARTVVGSNTRIAELRIACFAGGASAPSRAEVRVIMLQVHRVLGVDGLSVICVDHEVVHDRGHEPEDEHCGNL